jgi:Aerobic-type carbon monoxide dehydrogenase, large subunit CoxL/CutL homologs
MASKQLNAPVSQLEVKEGIVAIKGSSGPSVSYAQLIGDKRFNLKITGKATPKSFDEYKVVGKSVPRPDVVGKATGGFVYTQDVRIPGLVHARVVRPPTLDSTLAGVDGWKGKTPPGVIKVVVKKNFVAVVAKEEWQAIDAAAALKVRWNTAPLPSYNTFFEDLQTMSPTTNRVLIDTRDVDAALAKARRRSRRRTTTRCRCTARWAPRRAWRPSRGRPRPCGRRRRASTSFAAR